MSGDVAARYARSAETYESMWSPVIRPMALPLIHALAPLGEVVIDVGCGVGALFGDLREAGAGAVAGFDRSDGMLRRAARRGPVACADATALPVRDAATDLAVAVFMLHHVPDPPAALRAIASAVRPGGRVATATWMADSEHDAGTIWDGLLGEAGAPAPDPSPDSRERMDDEQKAAALMTGAELTVERTWTAHPTHTYTVEEICDLHQRYGRRNERYLTLGVEERARVSARFRDAIAARPGLLTWRPGVVYAVARR